ncbi:cysteine-rich receptor-like protein kinase 8 [Tanacetum coccineum]
MTNSEDTLQSNPNTTDINSIHHPLCFHQNDHPGLVLISMELNGLENYSTWRRSIMIALNARNKLKLINGEFEEPPNSSEIRSLWERANDMIISWILNTVSDQIVQLKQTNTPLELYYHKLKGYWDELDALEAPYTCTCKCGCENGKTNGEREQRKRLIQFLMGLDDSYTNIRGQILLMQPLPLVSNAYGMLRQEEKQRDIPKSSLMSIPTALNTFSTNRNNTTRTNTPNTTSGQTSIVGFPPGHPLHGKFIPPSQRTQQFPKRSINVVVGNENAEQEMKPNPITSTSSGNNTTYPYVYTKMDQLQNQLNQMLLMMQNQNQREFTATNLPHMAGIDYIETFAPMAKMPTVRTLIAVAVQNGWPIQQYGIDILRNLAGVAKSQRKYALDLLKYADTLDIKPMATQMDPIVKLNEKDGDPLTDPTHYRTIVGKLIYLTLTRPDLFFAAQALSQFSHNPRTPHLAALQRVLRYIKLCPGKGIYFPASNNLKLITYCDSDWASCQTTRRSSTEVEYRSLADSTCEISWLKCLLHDLGINIPTPTLVMCDNASTIALANNPVQNARTKHIEIDCHFVRDKIRQGYIKPLFVTS